MPSPHSTGGAMADDDALSRLMARLRSGEDAAAREVFARFAGRPVAMARGRFHGSAPPGLEVLWTVRLSAPGDRTPGRCLPRAGRSRSAPGRPRPVDRAEDGRGEP